MDLNTYPGDPWHADEDEDLVRIFRGNLQIIKTPKHGTLFEDYWSEPEMIEWMLAALNEKEQQAQQLPVWNTGPKWER